MWSRAGPAGGSEAGGPAASSRARLLSSALCRLRRAFPFATASTLDESTFDLLPRTFYVLCQFEGAVGDDRKAGSDGRSGAVAAGRARGEGPTTGGARSS